MSFLALKYDGSTLDSQSQAPARSEISVADAKAVRALLDAETGPVVFVFAEPAFERFLVVANPEGGEALIEDCAWQNFTDTTRQTTPLWQELRAVLGPAALRTRYSTPEGLRRGVLSFLRRIVERSRPGSCYFLAVNLEVWNDLARKAADRQPVDPAESVMRQSYRGSSPATERTRGEVALLGKSTLPILLLGESGTGKTLVARSIHDGSDRRERPFLAINGSVLTPNAVAALFGWVRGAFTGADRDNPGVFEEANGGTLFIDEVATLPLKAQVKLLKALEEGFVKRMGSHEPIPIDVRLITATNEDLAALIAAKKFRPDLYARIAGRTLRLPPLRERRDDIPELVEGFWLGAVSRGYLSPSVLEVLTQQDWPHNVRQLKHIVTQLKDGAENGRMPTRDELLDQLADYAATVGAKPARSTEPLTSPTLTVRQRLEVFERERPRYERLEHVLRGVVERIAHESVSHASIYAHTATRAEIADRLHGKRSDVALDPGTICTVTVVVYLPNEKRDLYLTLKSFLELQGATHPRPGEDLDSSRLLPLKYTACIDERSARRLATLGVPVPPDVLGLPAVLEFRTLFEHLTLRLRDEIDAPGGETPRWIERKLLELEGFVRDAQRLLVPIHDDLRRWAGSYGNYISEEDARRQLEIDQQTLAIVSDVKIATRAGKMAMVLGDWPLAIQILTPYANLKHARVLRDLGAALCKQHAPEDAGYQTGLAHLDEACRLAPNDPDTFARAAGAYRRLRDTPLARTAYERALTVDPGNPYALSGFLHTTLMLDPGSDVIAKMKDAIHAAVDRCRDRIAAGTDMPWALLDHGKFLLLLGKEREGLEAYAKAIGRTTAPWMLETTVRSLTELGQYASVPRAFAMAVHLLVLGWCARFRSEEAARRLTELAKMRHDLEGPVVLLVEAADAPSAAHAARLAGLLDGGLAAFAGTVLLVGRDGWIAPMLGARSRKVPGIAARILDYSGQGAGGNASTTEELGATLAAWGDVVGSSVPAKDVVMLFLGDDRRAAVDHALAAAVGARVGMVPVDEEDDGEPEADWGGKGDDKFAVLRDAKAIAALVADRA